MYAPPTRKPFLQISSDGRLWARWFMNSSLRRLVRPLKAGSESGAPPVVRIALAVSEADQSFGVNCANARTVLRRHAFDSFSASIRGARREDGGVRDRSEGRSNGVNFIFRRRARLLHARSFSGMRTCARSTTHRVEGARSRNLRRPIACRCAAMVRGGPSCCTEASSLAGAQATFARVLSVSRSDAGQSPLGLELLTRPWALMHGAP